MDVISQLKEEIIKDGFNFEPILDDNYHKIKTPIRGRYVGSIKQTHDGTPFAIMTVISWADDFKKTYKIFDSTKVNGEADDLEKQIWGTIEKTNETKRKSNDDAAARADESFRMGRAYRAGHPYLARKGIDFDFGQRYSEDFNTILIPCRDIEGKIWTVQRITCDGSKRFEKGSKKENCFFQIGEIKDRVILVEGVATGASIFRASGIPVVCCLDAGNVRKIGRDIRRKYSTSQIYVFGDNDESGVGQKCAEAAAKEVGGYFLIPQATGKDWNDCLVEAGEAYLKDRVEKFIKQHKPKQDRNKLDATKLTDLLTQPDPEYDWLVKDLLIRGGTSSISGAPKSGKSTLTRKMALCLAKGEPFFGRSTMKSKILYIAVEEKVTEVKKHFRDLKADGTEEIFIHAGYIPTEIPKQLREACETIKPDLIICDTFQKVTGIKDINDAGQVNAGMQPFHDIAKDFDCHILMVHHLNKGKNGVEAISGSLAVRAAFDCNMLLEPGEKNKKVRIFSSEQRYGVDFEAHKVDFDVTTKNPTLGASVAESVVGDRLDEIIDYIRDMDSEEQSANALFKEIKGKKGLFQKAIKLGLKKLWLVERKEGQKRFYSISPNAPCEEGAEF